MAGVAALVSACVSRQTPSGPRLAAPHQNEDSFILSDGARLPFRAWMPAGAPRAVVLALHGFNDSRDAWDIPGPAFAAAGIAVYAPDQRGFGAAPGRGFWPGTDTLVEDAAEMAALLRRRHPNARLVLMGESMGGAVLMCLATRASAPDDVSYVLIAPAVWGRARMNPFLRSGLWLAANLVPGLEVSRPPPPVRILASDNPQALRALAENPLTMRATRFDTLRGLVDLMDTALAAAPYFAAPALVQYGGHDQLIPPEATRATWAALPQGARLAFYPNGYHLLMRDLGRAAPIDDTLAWIDASAAPLPSGADRAAADWFAART